MVDVKKPFLYCAPAELEVGGSVTPVDNAAAELCCYKIKGQKIDPPVVLEQTDELATTQVEIKKPLLARAV